MATYKVWLTVKDRYGNTKEIDGGNISIGLDELTQDEVDVIEEALPLEDYIKRENLDMELSSYAKDTEVEQAVQSNDTIKYTDFELSPEE
jgi:hypothetical protein